MIMLSSDICRSILRRQSSRLLAQLQEWTVANQEIVISAITYAELVAASLLTQEQARHMALVEAFCGRLDAIVPWDAGAVEAYTAVQHALMRAGRSANMNDVMVAAHAISLQATLLSSHATTHATTYAEIPGLLFQHWEPGSNGD